MKLKIPNKYAYEAAVCYSADEIDKRLEKLGAEINSDYPDGVVLLMNQNAALIFVADLLRKLSIKTEIDTLTIGRLRRSPGETPLLFLRDKLNVDIKGKDVLVCTDIVRSGFTMHFLVGRLKNEKPSSLSVCALLHNPSQQLLPLPIKYVGFETGYNSLCGYGMAYRGNGRGFPDIVKLIPDKN